MDESLPSAKCPPPVVDTLLSGVRFSDKFDTLVNARGWLLVIVVNMKSGRLLPIQQKAIANTEPR